MTVDVTQPTSQDALSLQELSLYHAIMRYRASLGLAAIPLSKGLTTTAGRHVADTRENIWAAGVTLPADANLHSWSDAYYYSDHRDPSVMWDAPERVNSGYDSAGYEISAAGFATTDLALGGWMASPSHNAIIAQTGVWADIDLMAIGIGVDTSEGAGIYRGRVFHVWFGETTDAAIPNILGTTAADAVLGTPFADRIFGGAGDDRINGADGSDDLRGNAGNDVLLGDRGDDRLIGSTGDDTLEGGSGADRLWGNDGLDRLNGGSGADLLIGGLGGDVLTGGSSADVFMFVAIAESPVGAGRATITDFRPGFDLIDMSRIDAIAATPENDAFSFIGTAAFSGRAGEIRQAADSVDVDVNGDGLADMQIGTGQPGALSAGDFIL